MQALQADAVLPARNMSMSYAQPWLIKKTPPQAGDLHIFMHASHTTGVPSDMSWQPEVDTVDLD